MLQYLPLVIFTWESSFHQTMHMDFPLDVKKPILWNFKLTKTVRKLILYMLSKNIDFNRSSEYMDRLACQLHGTDQLVPNTPAATGEAK